MQNPLLLQTVTNLIFSYLATAVVISSGRSSSNLKKIWLEIGLLGRIRAISKHRWIILPNSDFTVTTVTNYPLSYYYKLKNKMLHIVTVLKTTTLNPDSVTKRNRTVTNRNRVCHKLSQLITTIKIKYLEHYHLNL
jgi:hypothetical protein